MKITQDVKNYAEDHGFGEIEVALGQCMKEKAKKFREKGSDIYQKS